jgi:hypothetical protein
MDEKLASNWYVKYFGITLKIYNLACSIEDKLFSGSSVYLYFFFLKAQFSLLNDGFSRRISALLIEKNN